MPLKKPTQVVVFLANGYVDRYDDSMSKIGDPFKVEFYGSGLKVQIGDVEYVYPDYSVSKYKIIRG